MTRLVNLYKIKKILALEKEVYLDKPKRIDTLCWITFRWNIHKQDSNKQDFLRVRSSQFRLQKLVNPTTLMLKEKVIDNHEFYNCTIQKSEEKKLDIFSS